MSRSPRSDAKSQALREAGCLNRRPEAVGDPLFQGSRFFDSRDLVQVKYEMVRRVTVDAHTVRAAAADFGFSRPSFYQAQAALAQEGLPGLVPKKRGPRGGHKLTAQVVAFLQQEREGNPKVSARDLAALARKRFGIQVHPRSVERALERSGKKAR